MSLSLVLALAFAIGVIARSAIFYRAAAGMLGCTSGLAAP